MKKWLAIGGVIGVVAVVGTLIWGAVTFAQGPQRNIAFGRGEFAGGAGGPADFVGGPEGVDEFFGGPARGRGGFGQSIDHQALLAEALGISVEQLEAAQEQAHLKAIEQAVAEGLITQEEADEMLSRMALRSYLDRDAITAEALGISLAELEQARADGKPMAVIIYELGLDRATIRANMQAAHEAAIQQAVTDGVITQEQADEILNGQGRGGFGQSGGRHGLGRSGGFGGPGGFGPR
jgi:ribosomal protein S20